MCDKYDGDARCIWVGKESSEVIESLLALGSGKQIPRMIVGALRDCGQIEGTSDVRADVYVRRVLGRAVCGDPNDPKAARPATAPCVSMAARLAALERRHILLSRP